MRILIACLLLLPFSVFAGSVGTTKTFASGDTLTATDLNGNVSALTAAIDDNDARITMIQTQLPIVVIDGNSQVIGPLLTLADDDATFSVLTPQGYIHSGVGFGTGTNLYVHGTYYSSSNCTGTAYTTLSNGKVHSAYNSNGSTSIYYVEKSSLAVNNFAYGSSSGGPGGCVAMNGTITFGMSWPTILNDPVVTGVSGTTYILPINLQRAQ